MREDFKIFINSNIETMPYAMESIGVSYCDESYRMTRSCAHVNVFEYVISGTGTIETSHGIFHPSAGDSYFLRVGESHNYYADPKDPWVKIWINVMGVLPPAILDAYGLHHSMLFPRFDISDHLKRIHKIAYANSTDQNAMYDQCLSVFINMCQHIHQTFLAYRPYSDIPENVIQLKNYIDLHLDEPLTTEKCNDITGLSTSQTIRSFRQAYGIPPYEYLSQRRIESAKVLLRGSLLSIQDIAAQLGFSDQYYFAKYFKKKCGISPKDYRIREQ